MKNKKPLGYLGGDIMTRGSNLARQEEYDKFLEAGIPGEVYSPVQNKSINDKSNMTEEENNCLAEKIVAADVERLWNSDYTVMCPEQSAIGTMCEMGILYGWKYMSDKLLDIFDDALEKYKKTHPQFLRNSPKGPMINTAPTFENNQVSVSSHARMNDFFRGKINKF